MALGEHPFPAFKVGLHRGRAGNCRWWAPGLPRENLGREGPDKAQGKDKGCHGLASTPPSWGRFMQHRELTEKPGHCKGPSLITQEMGATSGSLVPMCLTDGPVV